MLALAAPERLRIFDTLRREGPLSPAALTAALDEDASTGMRPLRVTAPPRSC
jgi:DNA-binding transcriptional ArsR family regulator